MREGPFGRLARHVLARAPQQETATIDLAEWCEVWGVTEAQFLREVAGAVQHDQAKVVSIEVSR